MNPYRQPEPRPPASHRRCDRCGLVLHREEPPDDLSFAMETIWILSRSQTHGGSDRCPGPPCIKVVPWWRALLELIGFP